MFLKVLFYAICCFLIYVNDIGMNIITASFPRFADDGTLVYSDKWPLCLHSVLTQISAHSTIDQMFGMLLSIYKKLPLWPYLSIGMINPLYYLIRSFLNFVLRRTVLMIYKTNMLPVFDMGVLSTITALIVSIEC